MERACSDAGVIRLKKTNTVINIAMVVLFAAMVIYLGVYIFHSTQQSYVTAPAVVVTVNESGQASGCVVREEQLLTSDKEYISISVDNGKEVARGGEVAIGVSSPEALESASRARELEVEIAYVSNLLSSMNIAAGVTEKDTAVRSAILELSAAVGSGDASALDSICMSLSSLLFSGDAGTVTQSDLDALQAELRQLQSAVGSGGRITAPAAGLFTTVTDGYESLTYADLANLTPDGVEALGDRKTAIADNVIGKLVTSKKWYFAAVMQQADAGRLSPGGSATLDFGRHYSTAISATVLSISEEVDGKVAVVFACNTALADTLAMREATAEVVYTEYTGIRVPLKAVHMDESGNTYVCVITAGQIEEKQVEIIYQTGDYCLVARGSESNSLRAGNEIVVSGKNLTDGKVVG